MKFISEEDISRIKQKVANGQTGAKNCDENQRKVSVIQDKLVLIRIFFSFYFSQYLNSIDMPSLNSRN
jgi:hypothetical protein